MKCKTVGRNEGDKFAESVSQKYLTSEDVEIELVLTFTKCVSYDKNVSDRQMCNVFFRVRERSRKCRNAISVCPGGSPFSRGAISVSTVL